MDKKNLFRNLAFACGIMVSAASCSDDTPNNSNINNGNDNNSSSKYVIAASVTASGNTTNVLLTAPSLDEGTVSTKNNGLVNDGATQWIYFENKYLYGLAYNQGNAGVTTSFYLNSNNEIKKRNGEFAIRRFTTFGTYGKYIMTTSTGDGPTEWNDENGYTPKSFLISYLDAAGEIYTTNDTKNESYLSENFLGNGEIVSFAGFVEANGKLYTSVVPMGMSHYGVNTFPEKITDRDLIAKSDGGSGSGKYTAGQIPSTQYPDNAFIAIYSGDSFDETPVIVKTDKIGFASGRKKSQYYQTIWAADNGDLYVFSPGYGRTATSSADLKKVTGQLPSGVVRIKAGETQFDANYYYNLEEQGTGHPMFRCWHITADYFLLQMYSEGTMSGKNAPTNELAVFKGESGKLTQVTDGLPAQEQISSLGDPFCENGVAYVPVTTKDGEAPALYKIDPATAKATKGLTIITHNSVSAIGKLAATN